MRGLISIIDARRNVAIRRERLLLAAILAISLPAHAAILVSVDAEGASGFISADSSTVANQNAMVMSGRAGSGDPGAFAIVQEGGAGFCSFGSPSCASVASSPSGATAGVVNMTNGSIRAFAAAHNGGGAASGSYGFTDVITFGRSRVITLNLDLPTIGHTGPGEGSSEILLSVVDPGLTTTYFQFQALSAFDGSFYASSGIAGGFFSPGPIPNSFEFILDFGLFPFLFPHPLPVRIDLQVLSECGGTPCNTLVRADSSLFVGVAEGYVSQNGYSYPGAAPAAVPEPSTLLLSIPAIALLLVRRWREGRDLSKRNLERTH